MSNIFICFFSFCRFCATVILPRRQRPDSIFEIIPSIASSWKDLDRKFMHRIVDLNLPRFCANWKRFSFSFFFTFLCIFSVFAHIFFFAFLFFSSALFRDIGVLIDPTISSALSASGGLSGISEKNLRIETIVHQAMLQVSEEGVEPLSAPPPMDRNIRPELRCDIPFVFIVRDMENGAIVFLSIIDDFVDTNNPNDGHDHRSPSRRSLSPRNSRSPSPRR
jgi:hypothetical protein